MVIWVLGVLWGAQALGNVTLYLNWKWEPQFGGFAACHQRALDQQLGFQLNIIPGGATSSTILLVHNRKAPLAIVSADELVLAHSRGQKDLLAIMAVFQDNPQVVLMKEAGISSLKDLLSRSDYTLFWQEGLPYAQYLKKKYPLKIQRKPYFGGVGILLQQEKVAIQGFETSEPFLLPSNWPIRIFSIRQEGFNPYTTVVITHREIWSKNPQEVASWWHCFVKGWELYLQDPTPENQWMLKQNPALTAEFLFKSAQAQKELIQKAGTTLGSMSKARWQTLIQQMRQLELISQPVDADQLFVPDSELQKALSKGKAQRTQSR